KTWKRIVVEAKNAGLRAGTSAPLFQGSLRLRKITLEGRDGSRPSDAAASDYLADISATVVSSMRLEKPHSLSYHEPTLTRLPETLVRPSSTVLDAVVWLKSTDTNGSSV